MASKPEERPASFPDLAGARMIEDARESVVQVMSGGRGAGAGVILDAGDGLVLTNDHVVAGRRNRGVRVTLRSGDAFEAEVVKRGGGLDLALLRLRDHPGGLAAARLGDSGALRVGELVFAIGHPWGRLGAVAAGIVSEVDAVRGPGRNRARYVRSDVVLAPGNSGGPLLSARGEVVGINAMIFGRTALSVPSNAARSWMVGSVTPRPRLGIAVVPAGLPGSGDAAGLVISAVEPGGPADRSGLLVGDVLTGVGDLPLHDAGSLLEAISGPTLSLRVTRGGEPLVVDVPLGSPGRAA